MMGWDTFLYLMIASMVLSALAMPKIQGPDPTKFEDIDFPQADEGTPQCVIFGDCWSGDWMVLGYGKYRTSPIKSNGGKK